MGEGVAPKEESKKCSEEKRELAQKIVLLYGVLCSMELLFFIDAGMKNPKVIFQANKY